MKTFIFASLLILFLAGCGAAERMAVTVTGTPQATCVGGVEYLQFTSGATVAYTPAGTVKTCNK
jgi:hypothetical protein